jgi:transcription elongation factor Elf1
MKKAEPETFGTYRCPVCGHGDGVAVDDEAQNGRIECSYCGAPLEISGRDPRSGRLNVRLADAPIRG